MSTRSCTGNATQNGRDGVPLKKEGKHASHATIPAAAVVYENLERADEGRSGTPLRVDDLKHFFLG